MNRHMRTVIRLVGCVCLFTMVACNTTKGAGKDLEQAGEGIQHSAERHGASDPPEKGTVMLGTVLLIVLILLLVGSVPAYPYSRRWGYGPSGALGVILIIVIILLLMGRI
jgi:predicted small secreted protein